MANFSFFLSKIDRLFPAPKYLNFDPVAIDISPKKIRLMKFKHDGDSLIPSEYEEIDLEEVHKLPDLAEKESSEINPEDVAEVVTALKSLKKKYKIQNIVTSLPELKTYIFRTQFPPEAASDVASSIRYSLEENVPLSVDDANFDYSVIKSDSDGIEVVVNFFPKKIIHIYTEVLKMAGLSAISFQSESVALARSVVTNGDTDPYLLVRLMEDRINVAIVEDNVVQYASLISVGAKEISGNFESPQAVELREALNKLLIFWFTNKEYNIEHKKIEIAYIAGDYAMAPGMQEFLERHLNIHVEFGNVWSNCFSTDEYIPKLNQEEALSYAVAIGLAIKGIRHA